MEKAQMIVGTRFNLAYPAARERLWGDLATRDPEEFARCYRAWELERVDLLGRYLFPSMLAQTHSDFTWLIMCDAATGQDTRTALARYERHSSPRITFDFSDDGWAAKLGRTLSDEPIVATARVDSDDALHVQYVERVLEIATEADTSSPLLVNFVNGCVYDVAAAQTYARSMENSPFQSLVEGRNGPSTPGGVYSAGNHSNAHERYRTLQDDSLRAWLMIVHGGNVSNHIKGADNPISVDLSDYGIGGSQ